MTSKHTSKPHRWSVPLWALGLVAPLVGLPGAAGRPPDKADPEPPTAWPRTRPIDRRTSANNLKMIALAMHNFHDANGAFPVDITDAKGKPLLSWRIALLPYVEEGKLYREFKFDEAWDSTHNKKLLSRLPKVYAPPVAGKPPKANTTYYQGFIGPDAPFNAPFRRVGPLSLG